MRWWNVLRPRAWREALAAGRSPEAGREILDPPQRRMEEVMLGVRLAEGLELRGDEERARAGDLAARGLLALAGDRAALTLKGRLLADLVVRELVTAHDRGAATAAA